MHCYSITLHQQKKRTRDKKNAYKHKQDYTNQIKHRYTIPTDIHTNRNIM